MPPGPGNIVVTNQGTAVIYLGAGSTVTATSGTPLPSGGVLSWMLYQGSAGAPLRAITAGGSSTAGFVVSNSYGLPQPGQQ